MSPRSIRFARNTFLVGVSSSTPPDRAQIEPQRVQARLDRQVDGRLARRRLGAVARDLDQSGRSIVVRDDLDAVFLQVGVGARRSAPW